MSQAFLRKVWATVLIYWQETIAYRASTVIWILADTQVALLMPMIWLSAYGDRNAIFGMSPDTLVSYYLITLLLSQFVVCHLMWDIAFEIREGVFTTHLLRPFPVFWMNAARNISWRTLKLVFFAPLLGVFLIAYGSHLGRTPTYVTGSFVVALILAHVLSFVMAFSLSLTSLWTTEFMSVFRIYYFPEMILSGRLVPLESLPGWVAPVAAALPFKYTVSFPANLLLGRTPADEVQLGIGAQILWIIAFLLLGRALFDRGTKQYTGFGN
jgi:ABC-2 type transport system permease protein